MLYSSLNNEQIVTLVDAFKKKYPEHQAILLPRYERARSTTCFHGGESGALRGRRRHLGGVSGPADERVRTDSALRAAGSIVAYEEGFKDPDGHWVNVHSLLNSMAYNTQLVTPERSAEEIRRFARAALEGPSRRQPPRSGMVREPAAALGQRKGAQFLKGARGPAAGHPGRSQHHGPTSRRREFHAVTNTYAHIAARIKNQGGPVQYVFDEPVITYVHPIALIKGAPHPNAGQTFDQFHSLDRRSTHAARPGQNSQPPRRRPSSFFIAQRKAVRQRSAASERPCLGG